MRVLRRVVLTVDDDEELVHEVKTQIRDMMADSHRFAGMCRYFVKRKWALPLD